MSMRLLRKFVFACILTGITALLLKDGELSSQAADLIQDRLQELQRTLQL
jgi:hypothetical protein